MTKPIAFMVMPFAVKATGLTGKKLPTEVDFDALWGRVYEPVLQDLGYVAVRADRDVGALIISEMIQRLAIADLVVADLSLPNANVYYELGVRHAARSTGCVLVAADWAKPLFDLAQMRQLRFPLPEGRITQRTASRARTVLAGQIEQLLQGTSPVYDAVPGYPYEIQLDRQSAFRTLVEELSAFDTDVRAIGLAPPDDRARRVRELVAAYGHRPAVREAVVQQLIRLLRDHVDWQAVLDYIDGLPANVRRHPLVLEQRSLALAKTDDVAGSAAALQQLMKDHGETSERWGLLGGRYKQLLAASTAEGQRRKYLDKAIDAYEHGMWADLNDYYPASNLPRLYRRRQGAGDLERAAAAAGVTTAACRRRLDLGVDDGWARASLLGMAFFRGDVAEAQRLRADVERSDPASWQLATTITDLQVDVGHHDAATSAGLAAVLADLEAILAEASIPERTEAADA
jgi:hypothetical protein